MLLFTLPKQVPVSGGSVYASAQLYFYLSGTSTAATVYSDSGLTTAHAVPVAASSAGVFPPIYLDESKAYKVRLTTSSGSLIYEVDPINAVDTTNGLTTAETAAGLTAASINTAYDPLDVRRYGAATGTDSTTAIQTAISVLGTGGGTITAGPGDAYTITATLDFTSVGNTQAARVVDFNGAVLTWAGAGSLPVIKTYDTRYLTLRNFTLNGANTTSVTGIFCDSLQSNGSDHIWIDSCYIKNCTTGILLGSTTGGDQNRVSDSQITNFLIEGCTTGIKTASTNVDNLEIAHGIISGCEKHINLNRSGFLAIRDVTGYGAKANSGTNSFVYIDGPTGALLIEDCQSEAGGYTPMYFLRRTDYTSAVDNPTTIVNCSMDDAVLFAAGDSGYVVNIVGGYFNTLDVLCDNLQLNLIGCRQKGSTTMTVNATNPMVRRFGASMAGTSTITSGYFESIAADGYMVLPNGLILQWGDVDAASLSPETSRTDVVTFPKAFPTAALNIQVTALCDGTSDIRAWAANNLTTSGVSLVIRNDNAGSAQTVGERWLALGY